MSTLKDKVACTIMGWDHMPEPYELTDPWTYQMWGQARARAQTIIDMVYLEDPSLRNASRSEEREPREGAEDAEEILPAFLEGLREVVSRTDWLRLGMTMRDLLGPTDKRTGK